MLNTKDLATFSDQSLMQTFPNTVANDWNEPLPVIAK